MPLSFFKFISIQSFVSDPALRILQVIILRTHNNNKSAQIEIQKSLYFKRSLNGLKGTQGAES